MILDVTLGTNDLARAVRFYDAVTEVLGCTRLPDPPDGWAGWGGAGIGLWLCRPYDGHRATVGNGTMVTLRAPDAKTVRAFHATAISAGGRDEGSPGTRANYAPSFYVAYVRDPDGHKIACVYDGYDPAKDTP